MRNRDQWLAAWDEHRLDLEEVVEEDDSVRPRRDRFRDLVVILVHITARGNASRVDVDVRFYAQFKVRDGKVVYIFDHEDRAAALEAAGLQD